jgi:hypothetical protein
MGARRGIAYWAEIRGGTIGLASRVDYRHAAQNSHRRENLPFWIQKKAALRRNLVSVPHRRPSHYVQANVLDVGLREVVRYFEFFCVKDDDIL